MRGKCSTTELYTLYPQIHILSCKTTVIIYKSIWYFSSNIFLFLASTYSKFYKKNSLFLHNTIFQTYEDGLSNLLHFLFSRKPMLNLILSMRFLLCSPAKSLRYVTRSITMWDEKINEFMQLLGEGKKVLFSNTYRTLGTILFS